MTPIHNVSMTRQKLTLLAGTRACRALVLALIISTPTIAQTDKDTVRWDDRTSQWVYTLFNPVDLSRSKEVRYTPRTLIEPVVKSKVQWDKDRYEYRYRIKNGPAARQSIGVVSVQAPKWNAQSITRVPSSPNMTWAEIQTKARAEVAAEEAFVAKTLYSPHRWEPFLNVNYPTRVVFGWLFDYQKTASGIAPRTAQDGFSVLRPELPGAGWMELQGHTPDMYHAATLPRVGAVAEQVADMLAQDTVDVPVMLPAIVLPKPYDGAELARRLKAHVATWPDVGLMDADSQSAMTPPLDQLIAALSANDKRAAKAAAQAILTQVRQHHPGMGDAHNDDDEDAHDSRPDKRKVISSLGELTEVNEPMAPIHRVAARAIAFNLKFLLEKMEGAGR